MSTGTVHVVGAGIAGLSAAIRLAERGRRVVLHEAAKAAGGRCRSYHDPALGLTIDNGNHLLLSGNRAAMAYLDLVGGRGALEGPGEAAFDFADLATGERWRIRPNEGRLPWWILVPSRRVPGTRAAEYLAPIGLMRAPKGRPIGEAMRCEGELWRRLWHPVLLATLNTEPEISDCGLAQPVLRETLGAGGRACHPLVATGGLSAAFVDPALRWLGDRDGAVRFGTRLRGIVLDGDRVRGLDFADGQVALGPDDACVLAVPAPVAASLLPGLAVPDGFRGILNAHFALPSPPASLPLVLGIVGGVSEWLFRYPDRLSVTVSAADRLFDEPREDLADRIWREVATLAGLPVGPMPPWQVVKERRATFAATPDQARRRPGPATGYRNLVLAGDWTDTGLPATIEGAIRSGVAASEMLQRGDSRRQRSVSRVSA